MRYLGKKEATTYLTLETPCLLDLQTYSLHRTGVDILEKYKGAQLNFSSTEVLTDDTRSSNEFTSEKHKSTLDNGDQAY